MSYYLTAEPVGVCTCPKCRGDLVEGENTTQPATAGDPWRCVVEGCDDVITEGGLCVRHNARRFT